VLKSSAPNSFHFRYFGLKFILIKYYYQMIIPKKILKKYWCLLMLAVLLLTMLFAIYRIIFGKSFNFEDSLAQSQLLPCAKYFKQKEPRIFCTIFTVKEAHNTKMKAIHETWSKRSPI
jgi:hypothetical protein